MMTTTNGLQWTGLGAIQCILVIYPLSLFSVDVMCFVASCADFNTIPRVFLFSHLSMNVTCAVMYVKRKGCVWAKDIRR
jgi:hypothetical protein